MNNELNQLKSRAYDLIVFIEKAKMELQQVNEQIVKQQEAIQQQTSAPDGPQGSEETK